jgi:hypothetical protein
MAVQRRFYEGQDSTTIMTATESVVNRVEHCELRDRYQSVQGFATHPMSNRFWTVAAKGKMPDNDGIGHWHRSAKPERVC